MASAHFLVSEAFLGPRPSGLTINHLDGNKSNNRPDNLEYVTIAQNHQHAFRTGLKHAKRGEDAYNAMLTQEGVIAIRSGVISVDDAATKFGVPRPHILAIRRGVAWPDAFPPGWTKPAPMRLVPDQRRVIYESIERADIVAARFGITKSAVYQIRRGHRKSLATSSAPPKPPRTGT